MYCLRALSISPVPEAVKIFQLTVHGHLIRLIVLLCYGFHGMVLRIPGYRGFGPNHGWSIPGLSYRTVGCLRGHAPASVFLRAAVPNRPCPFADPCFLLWYPCPGYLRFVFCLHPERCHRICRECHDDRLHCPGYLQFCRHPVTGTCRPGCNPGSSRMFLPFCHETYRPGNIGCSPMNSRDTYNVHRTNYNMRRICISRMAIRNKY